MEHFFAISPQTISFFGSRLLHGPEDLWKTIRRSSGRFECGFGYLGNVHEYHSSSSHVKNSFWSSAGKLFRETEKLISGQTETTGISLINFQDLRWVSTKLVAQSSLSIRQCQVYVFSDSVLCLVKMGHNLVEPWKKQIQWYSETNCFSELNRIDGNPWSSSGRFSRILDSGHPQ